MEIQCLPRERKTFLVGLKIWSGLAAGTIKSHKNTYSRRNYVYSAVQSITSLLSQLKQMEIQCLPRERKSFQAGLEIWSALAAGWMKSHKKAYSRRSYIYLTVQSIASLLSQLKQMKIQCLPRERKIFQVGLEIWSGLAAGWMKSHKNAYSRRSYVYLAVQSITSLLSQLKQMKIQCLPRERKTFLVSIG